MRVNPLRGALGPRGHTEGNRMQARIHALVGLTLLVWATGSHGEELVFRPAGSRSPVTLGRPQPVQAAGFSSSGTSYKPAALSTPRPFVRAQGGDPIPPPPPPPPSFGGPASPVPGGPLAGEEAFNCGVANQPHAGGGFFSRVWGNVKDCWNDVTGSTGSIFQGGPGGKMFQSDRQFEVFTSPVTNPFYVQDPRSLTEVRPIFMWQKTPDDVPFYRGGNNYFVGARGSVAFTPYLSLTIDELGYVFSNPDNPNPMIQDENGFAEIHLGPKVTFIRNDTSGTVAAAGLIFELPVGSSRVFQNTGDLGLTPYFSIAQNFFRTTYGSFNVMNTTGYSFGVGDERSDFFYTSLHLDFNVGNLNRIYPLIELNYTRYTTNGNNIPLNFEGRDLFHFGSTDVDGLNDLTVAAGFRFKLSDVVQFGIAGEFGVLNRERILDEFRLTVDVIFRY